MRRALGELLDIVVYSLGLVAIAFGIAQAIGGNWAWAALDFGAGSVAIALVVENRRGR